MRIQQNSHFSTQPLAKEIQTALTGTNMSGQGLSPAFRNPASLEALDMLDQWRTLEERARKKAVRWRLEQMPLEVFIAPHSVEHRLADELFQVLRQWEVASLGLIRFQRLGKAEQSHIRIAWSHETVLGRDHEVGHTNREVSGDWIRQVAITLIESPVIDRYLGREGRQARLRTTVLHEMGHALGLEHSDQTGDIMHHRGWRNKSLSLNDAHRIQALYQSAPLTF